MQSDENMLNYNYQCLDKAHCVSWHRATGMFVEDWCNYLEKYAKARGRDLFLTSNWNVPCCYFDATNEKSGLNIRILVGYKKMGKDTREISLANPEIEDEAQDND